MRLSEFHKDKFNVGNSLWFRFWYRAWPRSFNLTWSRLCDNSWFLHDKIADKLAEEYDNE